MNFDLERLYSLLPAIYRLRDEKLKDAEGDMPPLKSLLSAMADELGYLEENIDQLYDDQFIETCAEWVIPYIGELIGSRELIPIPNPKFSRRAEVANTISYRRRKGTVSIIEQLARDVTNWDANVIEYFQLLATTQYLNHLRPTNLSVSRITKNPTAIPINDDWKLLEHANTPFDAMPKTVDVRNIANRRGKYNIPNIGIFLWRIKAYSSTESTAKKISDLKYTFDSCGLDIPLYHKPIPEKHISQLAGPENVAMPISRRMMKEDLGRYYGLEEKILIKVGDQIIPVTVICTGDLSDWNSGNLVPPVDKVVLDPVLGRIMFGTGMAPNPSIDNVIVSYDYGFSADMGGGEYERELTFTTLDEKRTVSAELKPLDPNHFNTIQDAVDNLITSNKSGVVEILDNRVYEEDLNLNPGSGVTIEIRSIDGGRPILKLNNKLKIKGGALSRIILNGLLINGGNIEVLGSGKIQYLKLIHCTLKPHAQNNQIHIMSPTTSLMLEKSIVAGIRVLEDTNIEISNSIVDVKDNLEKAIIGTADDYGGVIKICNSTVIGEVSVKSIILAENVIFYATLFTKRLQQGCIRFSHVPITSITPRKYECQPTNEDEAVFVKPSFTSLEYGNPAYCQLHEHCRVEITTGADDESEMGVFHDLYQPQRVANLRTRLDEYLRFGMEAGIFYAS